MILNCVYQVGAPARVGLVAPIDVVVPPGNTGLDPSQTSFFQVLMDIPQVTGAFPFGVGISLRLVPGSQHSHQD